MAGDSTPHDRDEPPDPELELLYRAAVYEVALPAGRAAFRIGEGVPGAPGPFAVVTAWNPGRARPGREENEARNRALRAEVERRGWQWLPAEGRSPDGAHREPSFAVFGATLEEALALGRQFGQAAIVWFDGEAARLAWC